MFFAVFDDPGAAAQTPKRHFFQFSLSIAGDRKYPIFLCQKKARNRENIKKRNVFLYFYEGAEFTTEHILKPEALHKV